ncbi:ubiquitin protein ligase E3 component n-recognin 7 (putative) [Elysia marginata]|uniref:Ubiquitin protein ligase E3 component n-recognin 7 (Putative) n=1 Tax=Elysia marginata TaxID=1093978 RepID=A0AAV4IMC6_9GAST|nr:ubiquitin protein ligase E3 component n-recognin 7 (putative) [Elysia marginata]
MSQDQPSSNSSVRRCGEVGEGEDAQMTLMDALDEVDRLEADADAVLGGSDAYNCTYPQGYVKRQAIYACATCTPQGNAGMCLACSYACHEGHELYELYTKRHFKCDCGNEKFRGNPCQLFKGKKELNSCNRYSQNFRGLYCNCSRPYPDEEDSVEDEMIQCIICEDWYHGRHLRTEVPDSSDYHEMICSGCMCKYPFLWAYQGQCALTTKISVDRVGEEADVNVEHNSSDTSDSKITKAEQISSSSAGTCVKGEENELSQRQTEISPAEGSSESCVSPSNHSKRKIDTNEVQETETPVKKMKTDDGFVDQTDFTESRSDTPEKMRTKKASLNECLLDALSKRVVDEPECSTFWSEGWRSKLCRCHQCKEMYEDRNLEFLIDDEDTMQAYEAKGLETQEKAAADEEADAATFASMGRVQQIEVVQGVMDFKSELNDFLKGFAENGQVVKESDIREFFERMHQRKRNGLHLPQHNCR